MKSKCELAAACFVPVLFLFMGCGRSPLSGPPELRLGRDECVECGMIISEDRCSSAMLVERDGMRDHVLFDDIGCMLDYERESLDGAIVVDRFVHDYSTRAWVRVDAATFLAAPTDKLVTPMSSGMVAYASGESAEDAMRLYGGILLDYPRLMQRREDWDRQRRAPTSASAGD